MNSRSILVLSCALLAAGCTDNAYEDQTVAKEASTPSATTEPYAPTSTTETAAAEASAPIDTAMPATVAATTGKVDAIDSTTGAITIAHDPVDSLGWGAKTMSFKATPEQLAAVQEGDDVTFVFDSAGSQASIVSITATDSTAEAESE